MLKNTAFDKYILFTYRNFHAKYNKIEDIHQKPLKLKSTHPTAKNGQIYWSKHIHQISWTSFKDLLCCEQMDIIMEGWMDGKKDNAIREYPQTQGGIKKFNDPFYEIFFSSVIRDLSVHND